MLVLFRDFACCTECVWHPGSEQPVYLTLPAQRSSLLAAHNTLVQKTTASLIIIQYDSSGLQTATRHGGTSRAASLSTLFISQLGASTRSTTDFYGSGITR